MYERVNIYCAGLNSTARMMMENYYNCAKAPLDDTISILSYESEKRRLDKKLEKQRTEDNEK